MLPRLRRERFTFSPPLVSVSHGSREHMGDYCRSPRVALLQSRRPGTTQSLSEVGVNVQDHCPDGRRALTVPHVRRKSHVSREHARSCALRQGSYLADTASPRRAALVDAAVSCGNSQLLLEVAPSARSPDHRVNQSPISASPQEMSCAYASISCREVGRHLPCRANQSPPRGNLEVNPCRGGPESPSQCSRVNVPESMSDCTRSMCRDRRSPHVRGRCPTVRDRCAETGDHLSRRSPARASGQ